MQHHYRPIDTQQPVIVNQAVPTKITLPAFSINNGEDDFSQLLAEADLDNLTTTTITLPLPDELIENTTFALAVRSTLDGNTVRYLLHKPEAADGLLYATYTGQAIHPNATLEIWSIMTELLAELFIPIELQLGDYTPRGSSIASYGGIISGVSSTLTLTEL